MCEPRKERETYREREGRGAADVDGAEGLDHHLQGKTGKTNEGRGVGCGDIRSFQCRGRFDTGRFEC